MYMHYNLLQRSSIIKSFRLKLFHVIYFIKIIKEIAANSLNNYCRIKH